MNCNAEIYGRYCHQCGQENIEPKETAWGLITHFIYDITHFDGKFFSTLKYLLFKPGFLSKEYIKGRRSSYLHPIRMYVFTSAIFFIVFFSLFNPNKLVLGLNKSSRAVVSDSLRSALNTGEVNVLQEAKTKSDSEAIRKVLEKFRVANKVPADSVARRIEKNTIHVRGADYLSVEAYDSAQLRLPENQRDGWYKRTKTKKLIAFKTEASKDPEAYLKEWINKLLHSFPQLLFVSLPLFALLLKLLYIRRREFFYGDHAIFTIHLYIFTFISLFILMLLVQLQNKVNWSIIPYIELGIFLYMVYYTYRAMKKFYMQGAFKTFLKFCLLNMFSFFLIMILFLVFGLLSIYEI